MAKGETAFTLLWVCGCVVACGLSLYISYTKYNLLSFIILDIMPGMSLITHENNRYPKKYTIC